MKKVFSIMLLSSLVISCGNNETKQSTAEENEALPSENPDYTIGLNLIGKSDCLTCHAVSEPLIGPPYEAIAAKYNFSDEVIDSLAQTIIVGSVGKWGTVPMNAHPAISKEDAKAMVKYIKTLKK